MGHSISSIRCPDSKALGDTPAALQGYPMKKVLAGLLLVVVVVGLGRVYFMKAALASRYSLSDLQEMAAEANKSLPIMVDQATRLDTVVASEHRLEKRFTLVSTTTSSTLRTDLTAKLYPMLKSQSSPENMWKVTWLARKACICAWPARPWPNARTL